MPLGKRVRKALGGKKPKALGGATPKKVRAQYLSAKGKKFTRGSRRKARVTYFDNQIRKAIFSKVPQQNSIGIHRTSIEVINSILSKGLLLNPVYRLLSSQLTMHSHGASETMRNLKGRHKESNAHLVVSIPIKGIRKTLERRIGKKLSMGSFDNLITIALNRRLPSEWIVGYYNPNTGRWTGNKKFHPNHAVKINVEEVVKTYEAIHTPVTHKPEKKPVPIPRGTKGKLKIW